ncbi:MAG: methyltransferase [Armatimonadetes bacterium JP3_11]|nr:MAG: methyltransferase [Armatimonadetes bacterium JP3_11]RMH09942.1 MAG: MgtC/SapB family protein [Armatimonadota bacterium]
MGDLSWREVGHVAAQLLIAIGLSALIGWERELRGRPAGIRTHVLLCLGATLMMILSRAFAPTGDPGRIAAQIVSGVGFIGAGTILRQGSVVRGLTTAASLWAVVAIGMTVGMGTPAYYVIALMGTLAVYGVLTLLRIPEERIQRLHRHPQLWVTLEARAKLDSVFAVLSHHDAELIAFRQEFPEQPHTRVYALEVQLREERAREAILHDLLALHETRAAHWENGG